MVQAVPRRIGEFEVSRLLGESAVGAVYRAHHRDFGRLSHIRVLARAYTSDDAAVDLLLSQESVYLPAHINLGGGCMYARSIGRGRVGDRVFLVFSAAQTLDLETLARAGPLPWPEVRWRLLDICCGLATAHAAGVVHGDLQPGHCFELERWDEPGPRLGVRVTGFGLAAARHRGIINNSHPASPYMAPEQIAGAAPDERTDIYAAAMTMLHLLLGRPPPAWTAGAVYRTPADVDAPTAWPPGLGELLAVALAHDPAARYPTMRALATAIAAIDGGDVATALAPFDPKPPHLRRVWRDLPFRELRSFSLFMLLMFALWLVFSP